MFNPNNYDATKLSVEFDGIDGNDAPDFCDAYIVSAEYYGVELTDAEIESISSDDVHELLLDYLY